jgi:hypothetical protein
VTVDEIEGGDSDLIVHGEVISNLHEIFEEMEEQHQDSHFENSDRGSNTDVVSTHHSRPLPNHKEV